MLAIGGSCALAVQFAPITTGLFNDTLNIPSNDPDEPLVTVALSGTGVALPTPDITVTDSLAPANDLLVPFGSITVNTTSDKTVTIKNDGDAPLTITAISLTSGLAPFSITNNPCGVLVIGGSCVVTVQFAPTATGPFNDTLTIASDDPDENPVTVAVSGISEVLPTPDITVTDSVAPVDDFKLPFGSIPVNTTSDKTVTIKNDGDAPLTITAITLTNGLAGFSITNNPCGVLAIGGSCVVAVQFAPTATGPVTDTLNMTSDDPDENPVTVSLNGTGVVTPPTHQDVEFGWNRSSDPNGDAITYTIKACENAALTNGCITESNISALKNKGFEYAGLSLGFGLVFGFVMLGSPKGRRKFGMFMSVLMVSGLLLSGCGDGGSSSGDDNEPPTAPLLVFPAINATVTSQGGGNPSAEITRRLTRLKTGTTYHWQVVANDGNGGTATSEIRIFTTQ